MAFSFPHVIVGLDIGADTIKAVQVTSGFRGFKITGVATKKRNKNASQDPETALFKEIKALCEEESLQGDLFVSSIPSHSVAVRNIKMPFLNVNKVRKVIKYEVESLVPFLLEDMLVDFSPVNTSSKDGIDLLVMVVSKKAIKDHLKVLKEANIEPEIVDVDPSCPFYCYQAIEEIKKDMAVSIIDLGAEKTCVSIMKGGTLQFIRSIPIGGEAITRAVSKEFSIDRETAEERKIKEGIIVLEQSKDDKGLAKERENGHRISGTIIETLDRLEKEIYLSFSLYQTIFFEERITEILLTGGTSNIKNIDKYFEQKFNTKTSKFSPLRYLPVAVDNIASCQESILTGALGLALRGAKRGRDAYIDFRKEEYSFEKKRSDMKKNLTFVFIGISLIFSLFFGNLLTELYLKEKRHTNLKSEIRHIFTETFPEVKNIVDEVQQMKNRIGQEKGQNTHVMGLDGGFSYLDILREVHLRIPQEEHTKIVTMKMSSESVGVVGETDSFDTVDKITSSLKRSKLLQDIQVRDAKLSTIEGAVRFDIRMKKAE